MLRFRPALVYTLRGIVMNRIFVAVERLLLAACLLLLIFFYIYVYGMGKVRGPLARYEFYRRGEIGEEEVTVERALMGDEENLKSATESAETSP